MAVSPEHPLAQHVAKKSKDLQAFIAECRKIGTTEEALAKAEKKGFDTGIVAVHPFKPDVKLPVYVANFIVMGYGTGAIFGCPAHDQRDLDFARKYGRPVIPVVLRSPARRHLPGRQRGLPGRRHHDQFPFLDGLSIEAAKDKIAQLAESAASARASNYRLRDWLISRQRYWGCPIPVIHCAKDGIVPVPADQLPVKLPRTLRSTGPAIHWTIIRRGSTSRARSAVSRPRAKRTRWIPSSTAPGTSSAFARRTPDADRQEGGQVLGARRPVYRRQGALGAASAVRALLTRGMKSTKHLQIDEPFTSVFTQGIVIHETYRSENGDCLTPAEVRIEGEVASRKATSIATGRPVEIGTIDKMSKSRKNVVDPDDIIAHYGADTARLYIVSDSPPDRDIIWTEGGVAGAGRQIQRISRLIDQAAERKHTKNGEVPGSTRGLGPCGAPRTRR
jgi:leucyl-tRNA synthetase